MRILWEGLNNRLDLAEDRINQLEDRTFEITGAELVYTSEGQKELQILEITTDCLQPVITVDIPVNAESGWLNIKTLDGCVFSTPRLYFRKN